VNTVMNFTFHKILGSSRIAAQLAVSQEGLRAMKLVSLFVCLLWQLLQYKLSYVLPKLPPLKSEKR
jgi:hypothetical protein